MFRKISLLVLILVFYQANAGDKVEYYRYQCITFVVLDWDPSTSEEEKDDIIENQMTRAKYEMFEVVNKSVVFRILCH